MFLGLCPMLMAQNIQGVVTDTKGMPISFANVVELLQADSSFIKGTVSKEDGSFMLGENGAFPPTRDGCIHSLSMRKRG